MNRRWTFRPSPLMVLGTVAACTAMIGLGLWQLDRAQGKRELLAGYARAAQTPPGALDATQPAPPPHEAVRVRVRGQWLGQRQLLLDNQVHGHEVGYDVWTPLRLPSGTLVLVSRGWLAAAATRDQPPPGLDAPEGEVEVTGLWRALPRPGLRLGGGCEPGGDWPQVVQYPRQDDLACLFDAPPADGLLLMDPALPGGFRRDAAPAILGPERHVGYALQWFAFAATLFVLFVGLNLKRR